MKKNFTTLLITALLISAASAQSPILSFNYQSIARDMNEQPYKGTDDEPLQIAIEIYNGQDKVVYSEDHHDIRTSSLGIFNLRIGEGDQTSNLGMNDINWSSDGPFDLLVSIKVGTNPAYRPLPKSRLVFVPFAIYATKAGELEGELEGDVNGKFKNVQLNPGVVGTFELADNAVTNGKITNNAVTTEKIATGQVKTDDIENGAVNDSKLAVNSVTTNKIADAQITAAKLDPMGASNGQVLKWNGSWSPQADNDGSNTMANGDVSGPVINLQLGTGVVGSNELAQMGASSGQVLMWNGNLWTPSSDLTSANAISFNAPNYTFSGGGIKVSGFGNQTVLSGNPSMPAHSLLQAGDFNNIVEFDFCVGNPPNTGCGRAMPYDALDYFQSPANLLLPRQISIWADHSILAESFFAKSDKRIKERIFSIDKYKALDRINSLKVTNYWIKPSNLVHVGFIAQEVEQVFPEAVSRTTDFIPDIYQIARQLQFDPTHHALTVTVDSLTSDLKAGDKLRIIADQQREVIVSAVNGTTITVADWPVADTKTAFVYGKQVNDFRVVDYDRIFTLNVSATQALISEVDELKAHVTSLQAQNSLLNAQNTGLEKGLQHLENRFNLLTARLDAPAMSSERK